MARLRRRVMLWMSAVLKLGHLDKRKNIFGGMEHIHLGLAEKTRQRLIHEQT